MNRKQVSGLLYFSNLVFLPSNLPNFLVKSSFRVSVVKPNQGDNDGQSEEWKTHVPY